MVVPLLTTKLFLPPVRAERVQRERLLARLDEVLRPPAQLALISAPAGFGKTSLLAEWLARRSRRPAWLALDAGDNTTDLFLSYLCAGLERACPGLAAQTAALLAAEPAPPLETLLAMLVNELATLDPADPLVVALDDFQFVSAPEVRGVVTFLVEHLPPGVRLVIATRSDPPLPLARLRARGQMVELRAADMRFTDPEAADFLTQVMHLDLERRPEVSEALNTRTEGWAAGLQMAAVALRQSPGGDPERFLSTFSGSRGTGFQHFVLDYLAEEVLASLPAETVQFLLHTAVLERLNASLVAALSGERAETAEVQRCQAMLESLERANLFLIPLDADAGDQRADGTRWYRYHHLFADLLQARLKLNEPEQIPLLHRRAAGWCERSGFIAEAIQHHLAAAAAASASPDDAASASAAAEADYRRAAQFVEENTLALLRRGQMHALQAWVNLLPPHLIDRRPWLCINRAWIQVFAGQIEDVEPLLQKAAAQGLNAEMEGHCAAIRAYMHLFGPDPAQVFDLARQAKAKLPEADWAWGLTHWAQGYALRMAGRLDEANTIFTAQVRRARRESDPWGLAMGATDLSIVLRQQGRLRETLEMLRDALAFVDDHGARKLGYTGRLLTALGAALYEQNELPAARRWLEEAAALNELWRNPNHQVFAYLNLARVLIAQGEYQPAQDRLDAAARVLRDLPVVASLSQAIDVLRFNLLLAQGKPLPAGGALEAFVQSLLAQGPGGSAFNEARESQVLFAARVLLATQRSTEALRLLSGIEDTARAAGRTAALIELHTLKALAAYQLGSPAQGLPDLNAALDLAAPEGALRSILNAEPLAPGALRQLLEALRRKAQVDGHFVDQLLAALPGPHPEMSALLQPLSERELEVLRLMANGLTNAQIAERLVISTGTVKAHTASIFRKLDALNRTQAVARAREAGLV